MNLDDVQVNRYQCEVCGHVDAMTALEAFRAGWDYPPWIGKWGVVSPRLCPNCPTSSSAWWAIVWRGTDGLHERHMATINRILAETDEL